MKTVRLLLGAACLISLFVWGMAALPMLILSAVSIVGLIAALGIWGVIGFLLILGAAYGFNLRHRDKV